MSGSVFKWDGNTESFIQEECYHIPDVVKMEFQVAQGQLAWLASRVKRQVIMWPQWSGS